MNDSASSDERLIFEHTKRREWGLSVIAWETNSKRGYLFENGQIRVMAEPFYSLMREVDRPQDEVDALYAALRPELEAAQREAGVVVQPKRSATAMSFDDQLTVFVAQYSDGFQDPAWVEAHRGTGAAKASVRHRDPAIEKAAACLSAEQLQTRIEKGEVQQILADVVGVLKKTDLVTPSDRSGLSLDDDKAAGDLVRAVAELCGGEQDFGARLDGFVLAYEQIFQSSPSWQLATALPALVHPSEYVCVRPTSFREQAKWMSPRLSLGKRPSGADYARCLGMAKLVQRRLTEQGHEPRDLLDVYDFMRVTTGPNARKALAALNKSKV